MVDVFMVNVTLVNVNKYTSPMHAMGREKHKIQLCDESGNLISVPLVEL